MYEGDVAKVVDEVVEDLESFASLHGPMSNPQEGFASLWGEVEELWEEVKTSYTDPSEQSKAAMRNEATQVAAMAIRFVLDCCTEEEEEDGETLVSS